MSLDSKMLLNRADCLLVVIDAQERLLPAMSAGEKAVANIVKLVSFAHIIGMPILFTEQGKLGGTAEAVRAVWGTQEPVLKTEFDCMRNPDFVERLARAQRSTLLIAGFEAHICVAQTAIHASADRIVHVIGDAVASRDPDNRLVALERLRGAGITISSTEMAIYELLQRAGTDEFRAALALVK